MGVLYLSRDEESFEKTENLGKRIAFLEDEHSKSFAKWLRKEVERELAISKESVSETVRWISYGPRATVVKYDAYNINGYTFRTKCHDGKVYQNSGSGLGIIRIASTHSYQAFPHTILYHITDFDLAVNISQSFNWEDFLKMYIFLKIIEISSDSSEDRKGTSKASAPIFYGPSTQGLLDAYGYNTIEEYLSWNYFP
ncbi:hypothetical protein Tco_0674065 [Tanacetum coccineum]